MDLEYDKKFEEMKKYIPFLDSMIKRLRSTSSALGNPRQAQLDKILSLRDLLSNKKKRMKMENLLKCEQVLINLYAKVEQKDHRETLSKAKQVSEADSSFSIESPTQKEKSDLEAVRNKLKTVTKIKDEPPETLPAILTRNEVEEECTPGSKEPALFQRRPNRSPQRHSPKKTDKEAKSLSPSSCSRKSYTRVLVSPEKTSRNWSPPSKSNSGTEKPLFSRRSPRKSPRRLSPSYYKRERKKSNKESLARKAKDLNITLNVPEDCLSSLNNIDLLPRIMNCSEDDVDIDTLRKLRKQILGELKNTGTRDDISHLLLKSFKKKSKKTEKKSSDVEEGELSDSESETIESVYKSMIVKEQNLPNQSKASGEIRISFVINPKDTIQSQSQLQNQTNDCDLEMYNNSPIENVLTSQSRNDKNDSEENVSESNETIVKPTPEENPVNNLNLTENVTIPAFTSPDSNHAEGQNLAHSESKTNLEQTINPSEVASKTLDEPSTSKTPAQFKANFYNPITENIISDLGMSTVKCTNYNNVCVPENSNTIKSCDIENKLEEMNKSTEIPLLNEPTVANPPAKSVVSEIDILQALKNEILGEAISLPSQEVNTPLLHQPKVVKVARAQEILPKKRISIEKYKQKAVNELKSPKDDSNKQSHLKHSLIMKSSLKLTEKECERFKIPQISFDEDSYDDDDSIDTTEVYNDLAPTSPDQDHDSNNIHLAPPVIIPVDPIKNNTVNHMADVDMRTLPMLSPSMTPILVTNPIMPVPSNNATVDKFDQNKVNRSLDPRVRRDINLKPCTQSPSPHTSNQDKTPIPLFTCLTPSPASNPAMTPNARTYEMTPSHQTFEMEPSNQKHVYVPSFSSMVDSCDRDNSVSRDRRKTSRWDNESRSRMDESNEGFRNTCQNDSNRLNDSYSTDMFNKGPRNDGYGLERKKDYNISECPNTPVPSFGRSDGTSMMNPSCNRRPEGSLTPIHPFGRLDGSTTPSHSFGRSECPSTPSHSFGRSECPPTPSHSFGRSECPPTPSHSFGRSDCPLTPSHPFGRLDCPPTPSHSFGRPDGSQTPNHPFGRTESTGNVFGRTDRDTQKFIKDPRLNRKTDSNSRYDDKDRNNSGNSQRSYSGSDSYRSYDRDQSNPRNTKYRYFAPDKGVRHSNRDNSRRELSVGPSSDVHFVSDHSRQRSRTDASARELSLGPSSDRQYISEQDGRQHHRNYSRRESSLGPSSECSQNRERGRYNDTSYEEVGSRREGYNDRSVGRNISKGLPSERINNTLSVEPQTGCSFRIDTSVNTTFQNFLEDKGMVVFNHGFDARRQRAGSVGRALLRETSFERTPPQNFKLKMDVHNKRDSYRRAASVGRDLAGTKSDNKSFQEIKADFKSCRFPVKDNSKNDTGKHKNFEVKDKNTIEPYGRSRKEIHESKSDRHRERFSNFSYSPRKNYRDPRMRKEYYKNKNVDGNRQKTAGIVYSNDNIVKGAILSTGSGVKNYKIPKIKRLVEEMPPKLTEKVAFNDKKNEKEKGKIKVTKTKEHFLDKEKISDIGMLKKNTNNKEKMKTKMISKDFSESDKKNVTIQPILQTSDIAQSDDTIEVRQTRSRVKKTSETIADIVFLTRKSKKAVISDTDSEPESDTKNMDVSKDLKLDPKSPVKQKKIDDTNITTALNKNPEEHESVSELDTNFALDDLELFTDNAADAVTDNIDDLIADLDKDLHASKNESSNKFTKEINLENMLQNLTSPHDNKKATTEVISHTDMELNSVSLEDNQLNTDSLDNVSEKSSNSIQTKSKQEPMKDDLVAISQEERKENYDNMVSTSENNKQIKPDKDKIKLDEPNLDCISTPDSTLNVNAELNKPAVNDGIADSTGEVLGETNVSSTQSAESIATVSSLLSLLKDKSKIKELLNMLGDQPGDNEKVKKKLEKLEEIISDVDDDDETKNEKKEIESKNDSKDDQSLKFTDQARKPSVDDSLGTINPTTINKTNDNQIKAEDIDGKPITNDNKSKPDINRTENIINDEKKSGLEEENLKKTDEDELKPQSFVNGSENTEPKNEIDSKVKITEQTRKVTAKITRRTKKLKRKLPKKITSLAEKRVTRATAAVKLKPKPKTRKKTELLKLQEDIKEMFIRDDVLSSTGIRMCRLAKMIDEKSPQKDNSKSDNKPVVILEKHDFDKTAEITPEKLLKKKPGPKPKQKALVATSPPDVGKSGKPQQYVKYKPGPKSKTRNKKEVDPYVFETDSVEDTHTEEASDDDPDHSSDSENCSLASSKSFGSNELLVDIKTKKTKRKRKTWQIGVIPKNKKKKIENKAPEFAPKPTPEAKEQTLPQSEAFVPDTNCFTDKAYCFRKNASNYSCRLCMFTGQGIVHHYKQNHPHVEIPISRIAVPAANMAIEQCTDLNFPVFRKVPSDKYVCIFCYKEFVKNQAALETFFWHIVSVHTGEYKHLCSECDNTNRCPHALDIPPPPKNDDGQVIGYICQTCHFTQLSLENLKTHVALRHDDVHTMVSTINLAAMSNDSFKVFLQRAYNAGHTAILRSTLDHQNKTEVKSDVHLQATIQSKITFEADDNLSKHLNMADVPLTATAIKLEQIENFTDVTTETQESTTPSVNEVDIPTGLECEQSGHSTEPVPEKETVKKSDDIVNYPHFKINITESGAKEYICCINKQDNHFKTTLLISMKKHVQSKHSEKWDGYCYVCKVIVMPQGKHVFKDCLQHYLEKHMDCFPVLEKTARVVPERVVQSTDVVQKVESQTSKSYLNVRPLSQLISKAMDIASQRDTNNFPVIQSVMSLGTPSVDPPQHSPTYPKMIQEKQPAEHVFKYETVQAEVMSKKHRVVLETMMSSDRLIKIYKCAGRFCSFTSDSAEEALLHASTHQRIGGIDALRCSYCDFDPAGNAIDLVMHVFKYHGKCQYSCGKCFYRAAASQSVGAHMSRVHNLNPSDCVVLRSTNVTSTTAAEFVMLTRDQAVPYYVCGHVSEVSEPCKFRTYTPDKFGEHLQQKHSKATSHPCYLCSNDAASAAELIQHMKTHGLKLYQCTWCVHGADNEADLLAHVSTVHPSEQPQAYLRIITNKDGSSERRVLPLAFLNKLKVPTEDVMPRAAVEDPVREAERSIELEKLIGQLIIEPLVTAPPEPPVAEPPADVFETEVPIVESVVAPIEPDLPIVTVTPVTQPSVTPSSSGSRPASIDSLVDQLALPHVPPPLPRVPPAITPPPSQERLQDVTITPVKKEPTAIRSDAPNAEIVVLDSDDEAPPGKPPAKVANVIDLSDDDSVPPKDPYEYIKVPLELVHKCPRCRIVCKNVNGLKRHMFHCYPKQGLEPVNLPCPHCKYIAANKDKLCSHYINDHRDRNAYVCGICKITEQSIALVKRHVKTVHREKNVVVSSIVTKDVCRYVVNAAPQVRIAPKRKPSATATAEPPAQSSPEKRRYTPQEMDQLPMTAVSGHEMFCALCEFSSKVRWNMLRHLQLHLDHEPVPQTAPVNPVPHLENNEMHFDKMVNLASSSLSGKAAERRAEPPPAPAPSPMAPEAAARYPRHVPARTRFTCGAIGCSYLSLDEAMLERHWETLHSQSKSFHCAHCPPNQTLDTNKALTASRILSHLKMHDATLYACSSCSYYHFRIEAVEKHIGEIHKTGRTLLVRDVAAPSALPTPGPGAATMDLKAWHCGLCQFKSMLRPEVVDHCTRYHQSKMQFRCGHCPYRASAVDNIKNHLAHSHANQSQEIIHYYYKEGSLPEPDGVPRWVKQKQIIGVTDPEVKTETEPSPPLSPAPVSVPPAVDPPSVSVDLNLVKKEVEELTTSSEESIEDLCKRFGAYCDPNGIKFKCPLCSSICEDTKEEMQSHLYEELKYRKWGCSLCTYKAFHRAGLLEHMTSEHRRHGNLLADQIELQPTDYSIEKWVAGLIDHQTALIEKVKADFAKQKIITERNTTSQLTEPTPAVEIVESYSIKGLIAAFGEFGARNGKMYCCPKCNTDLNDEASMRDHLEMELNKIRWCCSKCPNTFQTYHEAQFHCKIHDGSARPKEAIRQPAMRAAWISHVLESQKKTLVKTISEPPTPERSLETDNSLLVVRYEEEVTTPVLPSTSVQRKRSRDDSDDESDDPDYGRKKKKNGSAKVCHICGQVATQSYNLKLHILKQHFNLKPFLCGYCEFDGHRPTVMNHLASCHPNLPSLIKPTPIPDASKAIPLTQNPTAPGNSAPPRPDPQKLICLVCSKSFSELDANSHKHDNIKPDFAKKGDVVYKCCICLTLRLDVQSLQDHHNESHPQIPFNYALFKMHYDSRQVHTCTHCNKKFKYLKDLKAHDSAVHPNEVKSERLFSSSSVVEDEVRKKDGQPPQTVPKTCAKKSTTKLPFSNSIAKKSTTKLPFNDPCEDPDEEYSYYNQKPVSIAEFYDVRTMMTFCNMAVPFTVGRLSEVVNIQPRVFLEDIQLKNFKKLQ